MQNPIAKPNLPDSSARCAAIGDYPELKVALNKLGINTITLCASPQLPEPVCRHADMLCCHLGGEKILLEKTQTSAAKKFIEHGFTPEFVHNDIKKNYPHDVPLNAAVFGKNLIANTEVVSKEILEYACINNLRIIYVKQGYAKCSVCIVNENAVITDDISIKKACDSNSIDALFVEKGSIRLTGHDYGFIGGCSGLIDKNRLAFFGDIDRHTNSVKIKEFLKKYEVNPLSLREGELIDVGGILPLTVQK
ncbi:MAG: hypothetical protein GX824_06210 [Clostridiales bacterium]|jgi:hypothetical protein|nr:hypothetical protein [Clostridiales bacterium]